jgi:hypothetical protein
MVLTAQDIDVDINEIIASYEGKIPAENDESTIDIEDENHTRTYRYTNGLWEYVSSEKNGIEFDERDVKPKKKAEKPEKKVEKTEKAEKKAEKVEKTEKAEKKAEKVDKKEKAEKTEKAEKKAEKVDKKEKAEKTEKAEKREKAEKKPKQSKKKADLNLILEMIEQSKIDEAIESLRGIVEKPKRKPSDYNIFFSQELKRLANEENEKVKQGEITKEEKMTPKERMKVVADLWRQKKNNA